MKDLRIFANDHMLERTRDLLPGLCTTNCFCCLGVKRSSHCSSSDMRKNLRTRDLYVAIRTHTSRIVFVMRFLCTRFQKTRSRDPRVSRSTHAEIWNLEILRFGDLE